VAILDRSFLPASLTVAPGGTVSWTNQSGRDHTVTGNGFDSGTLGGGGRFSHTFPTAGTFTYVCDFHSEMRASVTVAGNGVAAARPDATPDVPAAPSSLPVKAAPAPTAPQPQTPAKGGAPAATRHDVALVDYAFSPTNVSARVGDSVVWINQGRAPHTATAAGAFDTGLLRPGEQRTTALRTPGTFAFACAFHPEMTGVLTVTPADGGSAPGAAAGSAPPTPGSSAPAAGGPAPTTAATAAGEGDTVQTAATLNSAAAGSGSWPSGTAVLAALLGGAALLAGTGALLYGGSRMVAADERP
jgi:plastocyanin